MTEELKQEWISYLKGKQYKKGKGTLCKSDDLLKKTTWCCMGVLADIAIEGEWTLDPQGYFVSSWLFKSDSNLYGSGENESTLAYRALLQVGLTEEDQACLVDLNDNNPTWGPVIDYIERNL